MTFLQSIFLYSLAAALLPLLIHLFSRRNKNRVLFSSLYFLKILQSRKIRRLKLKQIILLIIRMLVVALLVFAFARPTLTGDYGSEYSGDSKISAVIILDNSLSSNAEFDGSPVFEHIRNRALEVLESLKNGDEIFVINTSETAENIDFEAVYDVDAARRRIINLNRSEKTADLVKAIQAGYSLLKQSANLYREIYLVSDMQSGNFSEGIFDYDTGNEANPIRVFGINPAGEELANTGVQDVEIRNQILERGKKLTVRAVVKNFSGLPVRDLLVNLYFDGKRVAQKDVALEQGGIETIDFQIVPERAGIIEGMIEIEDDALPEDNKRFFVVTIPEKIGVVIVNVNENSSPFLQAVLSNEFSSQLSVKTVSENELSLVDIKDFDVIVYNGFSTFTRSDVYRLRNFTTGGGNVIIFPSKISDPASFNRTIGLEFQLGRMGNFSGSLLTPGAAEAEFLSIDKIDLAHPVFADMFKSENPEMEMPLVYYTADMFPGPGARSILTLSNGRPFMFEKRVGQGSFVLFSSSPELTWSTLPLKGIFAPLIYRTVQYLASRNSVENRSLIIGDDLTFTYSGAAESLEMLSPDGESYRLSPEIASDAFRINFNNTGYSGIYKFTAGNSTIRKFAVNINTVESDLKPVQEGRIRGLFAGRPYEFWYNADIISEKIRQARSGKEITKYFIAAILIFLLIETIVQHERVEPETDEDTADLKP